MVITTGHIMMHVGDILSRVGDIMHTSEHHGACRGMRGGGRLPNKGRYGCAGLGIRYFRSQFLPRQ